MPDQDEYLNKDSNDKKIDLNEKIKTSLEDYDFSEEQIVTINEIITNKTKDIKDPDEINRITNRIIQKLIDKIEEGWKSNETAINEIKIEETELKKRQETIITQSTGQGSQITEQFNQASKNIKSKITELNWLNNTHNELPDNESPDNESPNNELDLKNINSPFIKNITETTKKVIDNIKKKCVEINTILKETYKNLAQKYKWNSQELEQKKSTISEDTKKKLAENNVNEEEYIQYTISRDKIYELWENDHTPETRDFLSNLKNLEDTLWIRNETARWLPLTANTATFEANPDLKKFKDSNPEISKLWNTSYFWKENIDTNNPEALKSTLGPYKKMELIYKDDANFPKDEKFQEISKKIFDEDYSNLTKEDINYYTTKLDGLNWWITDYIKWSAAQAPLTWILRYLDSYTWFDKETLQDRFFKWKDEFITMDDSTMRIEWIIDGNPLSFYYDTKDWQTKISCDDVLHIEKDRYEIYDWEWKYPRSDLKIKMPSTKDIVSNLMDIDQDTYKKILEGSSDAKEFKRKISDLINEKIKKTFPENDEIKTRMGRFTEKNLAAQAFDSALIGKTEYKKKINEQWEIWLTPIRRVLLLVDNTTEKSTSSDLIEFKWALKKLEWLLWKTVEEINKITDPVLRENLLKIKEGKEKENYENWEASIINFFKLFERKDPSDPEFKINIDDFSLFIDQWSKKENIRLNNFSKEFKEAYEKMDPEKRLAQEQWKKIHELWEEKHERESEEADFELMASLEAMESIEISTESNLW